MLLGWLLNTGLPKNTFSSRLLSPHLTTQVCRNKCNHGSRHFITTQPGVRPWHDPWNNFPNQRMHDINSPRGEQPLAQSLRSPPNFSEQSGRLVESIYNGIAWRYRREGSITRMPDMDLNVALLDHTLAPCFTFPYDFLVTHVWNGKSVLEAFNLNLFLF